MKIVLCIFILSAASFAETTPSTPSLTTADRIAIQACEKAKQQARQEFEQAQQQELAVLREWQASHPGFTIDPKTFTVDLIPQKPKAPIVRRK